MNFDMVYYTQIIFLKNGMENSFNLFEDKAIPLLEKNNGKLLYRIRPTKDSIIEAIDKPYEIHIIEFQNKGDFESYLNDKERIQHLKLKEQSVEKIQLIEGKLI